MTKMLGRDGCKPSGPLVQNGHHFRSRSFLWSKYVGSAMLAAQRISDIGGQGEAYLFQGIDVVPRAMLGKCVDECPKHAYACIAGCTAAQSHDDMPCSAADGICHQLSRSVTGCHQRVSLFFRQQGQPACLGYFYYCRLALQQIVRGDGTHQRVAHRHRY